MKLHTKILLGLAIGAAAGVASNLLYRDSTTLAWIVDNVAQPIGQVFLRMLFMVVVPLIICSITLGVAGLGDIRRLGRIGGVTIGFFVLTTAFAALIGLTASNVIQPGAIIDPAVREGLLRQFAGDASARLGSAGEFGINTFVNIIPRNPIDAAASGDMLAIIFFSLVLGVALTMIPRDAAAPVLRFLDGFGQAIIVIIGFAMAIAPIGVAALIFVVTARFGFDILGSLGMYVVAVLTALALHQFVVIGLLAKFLARVPVREFFGKARLMMATAFSTSSSNATLPTTIATAIERFGVPREIAGFVLPLGATMNMNGTALFEGMTVLFLAQAFGVDLPIGSQLIVIVMCVLTAIGAAGVPGGSIPLLAMVLVMVGVPGEGIAIILGVDRILDMARTVPNVTGDLLTSLVVTRYEAGREPLAHGLLDQLGLSAEDDPSAFETAERQSRV